MPLKSTYNIPFAPKTVTLPDGSYLHFFYANNKGRERTNCTIIRTRAERAKTSARHEVAIARTRTSAWHGKVNFTAAVCEALGLDY